MCPLSRHRWQTIAIANSLLRLLLLRLRYMLCLLWIVAIIALRLVRWHTMPIINRRLIPTTRKLLRVPAVQCVYAIGPDLTLKVASSAHGLDARLRCNGAIWLAWRGRSACGERSLWTRLPSYLLLLLRWLRCLQAAWDEMKGSWTVR